MIILQNNSHAFSTCLGGEAEQPLTPIFNAMAGEGIATLPCQDFRSVAKLSWGEG